VTAFFPNYSKTRLPSKDYLMNVSLFYLILILILSGNQYGIAK